MWPIAVLIRDIEASCDGVRLSARGDWRETMPLFSRLRG